MKSSHFTQRNKQLHKTMIFFWRLVLLSIPLYIVLTLAINLGFMQNIVATQSLWMFSLTGFTVAQDGPALTVGLENEAQQPFSFAISEDSTGWKSMLFMFALIFAVPDVHNKKRLLGLLFIPVVWAGNLLRIWAIVMIERSYGFQAAMVAHDYLWRIGLLVLVIGLWLIWLKYVKPISKKNK
ncbi:MAG: exosortase/archaeosortase family protein [Candidatus Aenigmatarchaeota archaeon]|nr:exosortase/archaeosortase family protein [Nanoarchaeota archaeon]